MPVNVKLENNSVKVKEQMRENVQAALEAMGQKAVNLIVHNMRSGYGKPIRKTGDLMRDVSFETNRDGENTVTVGNSLEYGKHVHEGTSRMKGRPYIRDALTDELNANQLRMAAEEQLKKGFE